MKKNLYSKIILMAVMSFGHSALAQEVYKISVKQAVDLAFKNVTELKNAKLDYQISDARNKEVTGMAYPQLSGSLSGNHYFKLPQIQFPDGSEKRIYDVLRAEGVRDGNGNPITAEGNFNVQNFSFFAPWNLAAGITLNQLLFEPQVFVGLQARRALLESSDLQIKVTEDNVREAVYKSYYAVLITKKQLEFLQESEKRLEKLSNDTKLMFQNGFAERLDIDKSTVSLSNTRSAIHQLKNGISTGYAALKMTLGLSQADSLVLTDALTAEQVKDRLLDDAFTYEDRNEVKLLNKAKELQNYDIKRYKLSYFPTVSAFYSLQSNGQRNPAFESFSGKPWFWYTTNMVGLNINVPLFDGQQKKQKIRQSQLELDKLSNTLDNVKKGIDLERTVAKNTLTNALLNMDMQEKNMELAGKIYNTEKKKYEEGIGSSFAILQSDTELQLAQSNYFRALYDAVIAKVSYLKALGKL
jgi:outer membrane protein